MLPFAAAGPLGAWPVWRIVCPPASGGALGQQLVCDSGGQVIYDWGGGLIWAAVPHASDAQALLVRGRVNAAGGHATLQPPYRRHTNVRQTPKTYSVPLVEGTN